jgi:hypothetical protein
MPVSLQVASSSSAIGSAPSGRDVHWDVQAETGLDCVTKFLTAMRARFAYGSVARVSAARLSSGCGICGSWRYSHLSVGINADNAISTRYVGPRALSVLQDGRDAALLRVPAFHN